MKCANCDKDSLFEYRLTESKSLFYCDKHLPKFLEARKKAGLLKTTDAFDSFAKEAIVALTPSVTETAEEPKSKKKAPKKKPE